MSADWRAYEFQGDKAAAPIPSFLHSATQVGKNVIIYGGSDYFGEALPQLLVFNTEQMRWAVPTEEVDLNEEAGGARYGHTSTLVDLHPPRIVVFGGMVGGATYNFDGNAMGGSRVTRKKSLKGQQNIQEEPDNGVYVLECLKETWSWSKPLIKGKKRPLARSEHTATKISPNKILVFGGWCEFPLNDVHVLDFAAMEWSQPEITGKAPSSRYRHTATLVGNQLFIMGGSDNGDDISSSSAENDMDLYVLDLSMMQWHRPNTSGKSPFPRSGHASALIGTSQIAVFGGKRNNTTYYNDLHVLDAEAMSWSLLRSSGQKLTPLTNTAMCPVGSRIYVFGGTEVKGTCTSEVRVAELRGVQKGGSLEAEAGVPDLSFKIIIVGDSGVGKSSILYRFAQDQFDTSYTCTLGIDFSSKTVRIQDKYCKLDVWDTAGQERYAGITTSYYRGAQGAMLVFDVMNHESFEHVEKWLGRVQKYGGTDMQMILVGNKIDLEEEGGQRQVNPEEAALLAGQLGIPYMETSAKTSRNIQHAFIRMATGIKEKIHMQGLEGINVNSLQRKGTVKLAIPGLGRPPSGGGMMDGRDASQCCRV